jgi:hypothetical protein
MSQIAYVVAIAAERVKGHDTRVFDLTYFSRSQRSKLPKNVTMVAH